MSEIVCAPKNDKEEKYIEYGKDGQILLEGVLRDGKKEGLWKKYIEGKPGCVEYECNYVDDLPDGRYTEYTEDGRILFEGFYAMGKKEGTWRKYTKEGYLECQYNYKNDKLDGVYERYFPGEERRLCERFTLRNEKLDGIWEVYDEAGNPQKRVLYANGKKVTPAFLACLQHKWQNF